MWDKGERILAVLLATALFCKVVEGAVQQLNMVPDAVDDLYDGCWENALKEVTQNLLDKELSSSAEFKKAWENRKQCPTLIPGGVKEHTAALMTYANGGKEFRKLFNNAVASMGVNSTIYDSNFHFKSLHFLLMDSLKLLNKSQCQHVYFISSTKYTANQSTEIRFGRFTPVSQSHLDLMEDPDIDKGVFFNITSCYALSVKKNICNQGKTEMLLSPAEVFTVQNVIPRVNDGYHYTEIVLKHQRLKSFHNCYHPWPKAGSCALHLASYVLVVVAVSISVLTQ